MSGALTLSAKVIGTLLIVLALGGVVTLAGRRVTDPLEAGAHPDAIDGIDTSDEPIWVELPLIER